MTRPHGVMAISQTPDLDLTALDNLNDNGRDTYADLEAHIDGHLDEGDTDLLMQGRQEGFHKALGLVFDRTRGSTLHNHLEAAFREFVILASITRPGLFADASLRTLGEALGVSGAAMSKRLLKLTDELGVHFAIQKQDQHRAMYSRLQKTHHWRKRNEDA